MRLNEIMHGKIDIGLNNFFFPDNSNVDQYSGTYLGPNICKNYYSRGN